jgi:hypothetical protein
MGPNGARSWNHTLSFARQDRYIFVAMRIRMAARAYVSGMAVDAEQPSITGRTTLCVRYFRIVRPKRQHFGVSASFSPLNSTA